MGAVFFLKPHHVAVVEKKGFPQVVFVDFESYEITAGGVTTHLKGEVARKFPERLSVEKVVLTRLSEGVEETVRATKALFRENESVELKGKVSLERSDGWRLDTSWLRYDIPRKLYSTRGTPFKILYGRSVVSGKNLNYYRKSGKIKAESIRAKIAEEDI